MDFEKKELYTTTRKSGVNVSDPKIAELWLEVCSEESPINFLLLKYVTANDVSPCNHGAGGLEEMLSCLDDSEIFFGGIRVLIGGSVKFFSFFFVGESVNGMKKGKASLHKPAVLNSLQGTHGDLTVNGLSEASREYIIDQISKLTGCVDTLAIIA